MGLFNWFRKEKKVIKTDDLPSSGPDLYKEAQKMTPHKISGIQAVADRFEQMSDAVRQIDGMKAEYETVTALLTDIQKIDRIPADDRERLEAAARNITIYEKERDKYKDKDTKLTQTQRSLMERQEDKIANDLKNMRKNEEYNGIIKSDLHHLEGEKGSLFFEQEEALEKQTFLRKSAITVAVLVISLFALIATLAYAFERNLTTPYLLTVLMAAVAETYIFMEENKNRQDMRLTERKLQKAIGLLNKVKIKYVNNMSLLEYSYEKYDVGSSAELDYIWKQYVIVRENEKKYRLNTEKLNESIQILLDELQKYHLTDKEIWTHQALALIEKKEMVEVRHHLNVRRQKIRDNLDYNTKTYNKNKTEIMTYMEENPSMESEIKDIATNYGISL